MKHKKVARSFEITCSILMTIAAIIWGTAFVAQSEGMNHIEGFTFTTIRSFIGAIVLLPVLFVVKYLAEKRIDQREDLAAGQGQTGAGEYLATTGSRKIFVKEELIGGIVCGTALCAASNFQQFGIAYTTVAKAGFLTDLYVIIIPLLGLFMRKAVPAYIWICTMMSLGGMYLLCLAGKGSVGFTFGDILVIVCAFLFAAQIMAVAYYAKRCRSIQLSIMQFFICGVESLILTVIFETPSASGILAALPSLLYVGVFSSGVAYTLQTVAQSGLSAPVASLIMSLESVISAVSGWLILGQAMSGVEMIGAAVIFLAIVLAQVIPSMYSPDKDMD